METHETFNIALYCGESGHSLTHKWQLPDNISITERSVEKTSRSYLETVWIERLSLNHTGEFRCGDSTLLLKIKGNKRKRKRKECVWQ